MSIFSANTILGLVSPRIEDMARGAAVIGALASQVEAALRTSGRQNLRKVSAAAQGLAEGVLRSLEPEVRSAILGSDASGGAFRAAYRAGQVAFAQLVTAQAAHFEPDARFLEFLTSRPTASFVDALYMEELSNVELATKLGFTPEHASRTLKLLRDVGISDSRKEGRIVVNFLTQSAIATLRSLPGRVTVQKVEEARITTEKEQFFQSRVPEHMQRKPSFGRRELLETELQAA